MGIVAGGIIFAGGAAVAWAAGSTISRWLPRGVMSWVAHIFSTAIIFHLLGFLILLVLGYGEAAGMDFAFTGIVAIAAMADGAVGAWFGRPKKSSMVGSRSACSVTRLTRRPFCC